MDMLVDKAAPLTSIPNPATNVRSKIILEMHDTSKNHKEALRIMKEAKAKANVKK